jgi:FkbM family methyltransferase
MGSRKGTALRVPFRAFCLLGLWRLFQLNSKFGSNVENAMVERQAKESHVPTVTTLPECSSLYQDDPNRVKESLCSEDQLLKIDLHFDASKTQCPRSTWLAKWLPRPCFFTFISVGCNMGVDAVQMAKIGTQNPVFHVQKYMEHLLQFSPMMHQPVCGLLPIDPVIQITQPRTGEIHCIEPVSSIVKITRQVARNMHLPEAGFNIQQGALSNRTGTVFFEDPQAGNEGASLDTPCVNCIGIPMYTLDDYVEQFVRSKDRITVLTISAEGFDFDVLQGSWLTLKRVDYLEFEVINRGSWLSSTVIDAIQLLEKEFVCYWAGNGKLWRLTGCLEGPVKMRYIHNPQWSNVACVARSNHELWRIMEDIFLHESLMD